MFLMKSQIDSYYYLISHDAFCVVRMYLSKAHPESGGLTGIVLVTLKSEVKYIDMYQN